MDGYIQITVATQQTCVYCPRHVLRICRDQLPLQRPHGRWHDLARASTVALNSSRVAVARV